MLVFMACFEKEVVRQASHAGLSVISDLDDTAQELLKSVQIADCDAVIINIATRTWSESVLPLLREKIDSLIIIGYEEYTTRIASSEARVRFLDRGGDDLLFLPFHPAEAGATLRACMRRTHALHALEVFLTTPHGTRITINMTGKTVKVNDVLISLSKQETTLLFCLASSSGIMSRERIMDRMYPAQYDRPDMKVIDVFITKIRKKLSFVEGQLTNDAGTVLETVWGIGYRLRRE